MKQLLLIPDRDRIKESLELAERYHAGFEYNDFYAPDVLDDPGEVDRRVAFYQSLDRDRSRDTMHGAFLDITIHSQDRMIREASMQRIRQSMEIAARLGVRGVVFHTGRLAGFRVDYYIRHWKETNEAFFREMLKEYPEQEIYMENMFDESPDILRELAEDMKDETRFGICLDYAHAALTTYSGEDWLEMLAPYVKHMHINDNDFISDLHLAVGEGKINWDLYERLMWQYGVNASVLVEVKDLELQRRSLEYMEKYSVYPMDQDA